MYIYIFTSEDKVLVYIYAYIHSKDKVLVYRYIYIYITPRMRIGDCLSDYIPVIDVDVCCSSNDFTKTTASAWRSFSLLLQWVLSQKGDCHTLWLWVLE